MPNDAGEPSVSHTFSKGAVSWSPNELRRRCSTQGPGGNLRDTLARSASSGMPQRISVRRSHRAVVTALGTRSVLGAFPLCGLVLAATLTACGGAGDEDRATGDESALIGGSAVPAGQLGATLQLSGGCTASKVGPRHILLAAHCVYDRGVRDAYVSGARFSATTTALTPLFLTVKAVHVSPSWLAACADRDCSLTMRSPADRPSDVAILETFEEIEGIPGAVVDTEPVSPNEAVIVVGAGCESGVQMPSYLPRTFKAGVTRIADPNVLLHPGSHVRPEDVARVAAHDLITPGPAFGWTQGSAVGLCPGDSGGPVFRLKGRGATVVGVNTSYTFSGARSALPLTNWHARLDDATEIAAWLAALGVSTCRGASCPVSPLSPDLPGVDGDVPSLSTDALIHADGRDGACQAALYDMAPITAATSAALGAPSFCFPVNGMRFEHDVDYYYAAVVLCAPQGPTPATPHAFASMMQAQGYSGFVLEGALVRGAQYTAPCGTYPSRDETCRALLADDARMAADVTYALSVPASCETSDATRAQTGGPEGDIWYAKVSCTLATQPAKDRIASFASHIGQLGRHSLDYDAGANRVEGVTYSPYCATLGL